MEPVTAFMRTEGGCGRKPVRIGQVTPWVVQIERVAAMHAGLGLDHTDQDTPWTDKSALVSELKRVENVAFARPPACVVRVAHPRAEVLTKRPASARRWDANYIASVGLTSPIKIRRHDASERAIDNGHPGPKENQLIQNARRPG